ncbi:MAG: hypothetical protein WDO24_10945 [Pseudomonadota bacterium]
MRSPPEPSRPRSSCWRAATRSAALSLDSLFWLRQQAFGPLHGAETSPTAVIAIDEETARTPPFGRPAGNHVDAPARHRAEHRARGWRRGRRIRSHPEQVGRAAAARL